MRTFTDGLRSGDWLLVRRATATLVLALSGCAAATLAVGPADPVQRTAIAHAEAWPAAASPAALTSPRTEAAIDDLLGRMTLEQKVGQLIQADIGAITPADLAQYPLGSILAGGNSGPYGDERASAAKWRQLVNEFRAASRVAGAQIPILFGVDAVHGHSNLPGATIFPHNIGLGAAHDPAMIERIGAATAAEIAGSGIEWTFAPTLAVPQDLRWGRTYEGYSSQPSLVASYARAMTLGLQGRLENERPLAATRVAATAKHFLADGGTGDGRDQGDAQIGEADLIATHAQGYPPAIDAGALTVMVSFSSWNGVKNHGNATLLTDVLKGRMGFGGLVVGDWNGHGQVPGCSATDCPAAINAGVDLLMAPESWKGLFKSALAAARDGRIPAARIDDAVRRILRVKYKLGLMGSMPTQRGNQAAIGSAAHLELAREAVAKSLVLLKNNDGLLPLKPGARVLITGRGSDNMAMQAGGWTISWQGTDTRTEDFTNGQTIGRAIGDAVRANGGTAIISANGKYSAKPDVAVVIIGEPPYAEFEGDVPDLAFRAKAEDTALLAQLKSEGIRVVVVFLSGRPMFTGNLINRADAFVAAWLPGTQGRGVADVLVGGLGGKSSRDFTGRLPFAWPADARSPILTALFPVGYGLSYARPVQLGAVNEDPRIDLSPVGPATTYLIRGKVPAPWHLEMDGAISATAADLSAQEDARRFKWERSGALAINGPPVNLLAQLNAGDALLIEWRIDQPTSGPVLLTFGEATVDLGDALRIAPSGTVIQTYVPLTCLNSAGAKLNAVGLPLRIAAQQGFTATIRSVRIAASTAPAACPPTPR